MEIDEVRSKVIELLKPFIRRAPSGVVPGDDSRLLEDLNIDSADFVDLVLSVEETFRIQVPDESMEGLVTIGSLVRYVQTAVHVA